MTDNIQGLNPPTPAEGTDEPDHFNYRIIFKNEEGLAGATFEARGYIIMTAALIAVVQRGYVEFVTHWDNVYSCVKLPE